MEMKIDLNRLGKLICEQAKEKGWGYTKNDLIVSEKMILISTEITELEEARSSKTALPKDTMASEYADVLTRTLHLGTAWKIDFNKERKYRSKIKSKHNRFQLLDLLYLHDLVAKGFEYYRKKKIGLFKKYLYVLAHEVVILSESERVDIEKGAIEKMKINKPRVWSKKDINENLQK